MNIDEEISNHLQWIELVASLLSPDAPDDGEIDELTSHDQCSLGHWIESADAQKYRDSDTFQQLDKSHAAFHDLAGDLVILAQQDSMEKAEEVEERFIHLSQEVIEALQAFKAEYDK